MALERAMIVWQRPRVACRDDLRRVKNIIEKEMPTIQMNRKSIISFDVSLRIVHTHIKTPLTETLALRLAQIEGGYA